MQDAKEEVRSRLAIEDVIGEYVELKRAGRNLKGLSPFTDERTPSFMVSPEKQIWHDFSSGKGGDIFSFVMLVEGLDFRSALEHLARKAGVDLAMFSGGDGRTAKRRTRAKEALSLAARFYQQVLLRTPLAMQYISQKRRLSKQTVANFYIGFSPSDGSSLVKALTKRGFSRQELMDAGLTNRYGGDLFRGRMMVVLSDTSGDPIGFTGRIIEDDPKAPKYLNTPQTLLFDKSRHIFGLYQAKEAIRRANVAVIVEGNLDVVSSHQVGVKNVVATAGTAMTEQHLKILSRLASRVRLAFDGDKAGLAATERAIILAQAVGIDLEVVSMLEGAKDPDELIQRDPELWRRAIDHALPAVEWVIRRYSERENLESAEGKRRFSTAALNLIRNLKDPVEQEHYLKEVSIKSGASLTALRSKLTQTDAKAKPQSLRSAKIEKQPIQAKADDTEDTIVGLVASYPGLRRWLPAIKPEMVDSKEARSVLAGLADIKGGLDIEKLPLDLQKFEQYVKIVQLKSDSRYANWELEALDKELARLVKKLVTKHRQNKKQQLLDKLRDAEELNNEELAGSLRQQLNALIKEK